MPVITFLVEDSATIRTHLIPAIEDLGRAEVIAVAETEMEAKEWLKSYTGELQLVITDLLLREGSGFGVLKHFRQERPNVRVVVLSNYATPLMRERAGSMGATAVFDKSTELEEFLAFCAALSS
ncbi:response regulator [Variovorax paradoxus]|nr:response regulator [Variovorax paradoxus]MBT2303993.1 response regulator [Variovorax paradoxus]